MLPGWALLFKKVTTIKFEKYPIKMGFAVT